MPRYLLEVYCKFDLIFIMEFRSITNLAKTIDKFFNIQKLELSFNIYDLVKDRDINADELMRIWHS